jgi:hypothetical protein
MLRRASAAFGNLRAARGEVRIVAYDAILDRQARG